MLGGAGIAMLLDRVGSARVVIVDFGAVALPALGLGVLAATIGWVELVRPRLSRVNARTIELRTVQPADSAAFRALQSRTVRRDRRRQLSSGAQRLRLAVHG